MQHNGIFDSIPYRMLPMGMSLSIISFASLLGGQLIIFLIILVAGEGIKPSTFRQLAPDALSLSYPAIGAPGRNLTCTFRCRDRRPYCWTTEAFKLAPLSSVKRQAPL